MLALPRLAQQRTQRSQPAVHPVFAAQFSVPVAHVALSVPSVLSIGPLFAGSWHSVPEGITFAMTFAKPQLTFGVDASRLLGGQMLSLFAASSGRSPARCQVFAACSALGASSMPRVCSTGGAEGARLRHAWHGTRGVSAVSHVLRSRRCPPCRQRSWPMLGLIDAACSAASCAPCPQRARPRGPPPGWIPAPGAGLRSLHRDFPAASSKFPLPPSDPVPPPPLRGPGQSWAWLPRLASRGGQEGCPRHRRCWGGRGIKVEVLITQMSGNGERWFPW